MESTATNTSSSQSERAPVGSRPLEARLQEAVMTAYRAARMNGQTCDEPYRVSFVKEGDIVPGGRIDAVYASTACWTKITPPQGAPYHLILMGERYPEHMTERTPEREVAFGVQIFRHEVAHSFHTSPAYSEIAVKARDQGVSPALLNIAEDLRVNHLERSSRGKPFNWTQFIDIPPIEPGMDTMSKAGHSLLLVSMHEDAAKAEPHLSLLSPQEAQALARAVSRLQVERTTEGVVPILRDYLAEFARTPAGQGGEGGSTGGSGNSNSQEKPQEGQASGGQSSGDGESPGGGQPGSGQEAGAGGRGGSESAESGHGGSAGQAGTGATEGRQSGQGGAGRAPGESQGSGNGSEGHASGGGPTPGGTEGAAGRGAGEPAGSPHGSAEQSGGPEQAAGAEGQPAVGSPGRQGGEGQATGAGSGGSSEGQAPAPGAEGSEAAAHSGAAAGQAGTTASGHADGAQRGTARPGASSDESAGAQAAGPGQEQGQGVASGQQQETGLGAGHPGTQAVPMVGDMGRSAVLAEPGNAHAVHALQGKAGNLLEVKTAALTEVRTEGEGIAAGQALAEYSSSDPIIDRGTAPVTLDRQRILRVASTIEKAFRREDVEMVHDQRPRGRVDFRRVHQDRDDCFMVREDGAQVFKRPVPVTVVVDCSGSMSGRPNQEGRYLMAALGEMEKRGVVTGHAALSMGVGGEGLVHRYQTFPLSQMGWVAPRIPACGGRECIQYTLERIKNLTRRSLVMLYTDGCIGDLPVDKEALHRQGVYVYGLYVGKSSTKDTLSEHVDFPVASESIDGLAKDLARLLRAHQTRLSRLAG